MFWDLYYTFQYWLIETWMLLVFCTQVKNIYLQIANVYRDICFLAVNSDIECSAAERK